MLRIGEQRCPRCGGPVNEDVRCTSCSPVEPAIEQRSAPDVSDGTPVPGAAVVNSDRDGANLVVTQSGQDSSQMC